MKKGRIFSVVVLIITSFVLLVVNLRNSHAYYLDEDGNIITSSFNGEIMLGGGELTTDDKSYSNFRERGMVLWILGGNFTMNHPTVSKTGDGIDEDYSNGGNSAIVIQDEGKYIMNQGTIVTDAIYAHGMVAYQGGKIQVNDTSIVTKKDYSSGVMVSDGGSIIGNHLTIETFGDFSPAIQGLGGESITVDGDNFQTNGIESPVIYSSLDVSVRNATMMAMKSEGVVIPGNYSVLLENCTLTSTNSFSSYDKYKNIYIYQSDVKDSDGRASFVASNSKLITNNGDTFYVMDSNANIKLTNNDIINNDGNFLTIGESGYESGSSVILDMYHQSVTGNISINDISKLDMNLRDGSSYTGSIHSSHSESEIRLSISSDSNFILMEDTYLSYLEDEDDTYANIQFNGYRLFVGDKELVVNHSTDVKEDESSHDDSVVNHHQSNDEPVINHQQSNDDSVINSKDNDIEVGQDDKDVDDVVINNDTVDGENNLSDNNLAMDNHISNSRSIYYMDQRKVMIINIIGVVLIVTSIVYLIKTWKLKEINHYKID